MGKIVRQRLGTVGMKWVLLLVQRLWLWLCQLGFLCGGGEHGSRSLSVFVLFCFVLFCFVLFCFVCVCFFVR